MRAYDLLLDVFHMLRLRATRCDAAGAAVFARGFADSAPMLAGAGAAPRMPMSALLLRAPRLLLLLCARAAHFAYERAVAARA